VRNGGFQPLLLNPIDFVDLYRSGWQPRRRPRRPNRSIQADVIAPDRAFAERSDKRAVRFAFFGCQPYGERGRTLAHDDDLARNAGRRRCLRENKLRLAGAINSM